ncbi:MAG: winged helix-turn-helix transcriptional regulator [Dehalococcoidales bacterium]|nr:winged helix-turn-helix transcriptional regulator [Dehalococcoidales bacterium]
MRELVRIYKALSDESRLRVLNLLLERECCVCEIEQVMEVSQSKASRILSTLYDAGFLNLRKEGLWSLYSIDWEGMDDSLESVLTAARKGFSKNLKMQEDCQRLQNTARLSPCCSDSKCSGEEIPEMTSVVRK